MIGFMTIGHFLPRVAVFQWKVEKFEITLFPKWPNGSSFLCSCDSVNALKFKKSLFAGVFEI